MANTAENSVKFSPNTRSASPGWISRRPPGSSWLREVVYCLPVESGRTETSLKKTTERWS